MAKPQNASTTPALAIFDLDGTLIRGDSLVPFLWSYATRHRRRWALLRGAAYLVPYAARLLSARSAKEHLLRQVLGGEPLDRIQAHAEVFARDWAVRHLHPIGVARLREHQCRGDRIILLSASPDLYVPMIARELGVAEVVCTRVEVVGNRCTGKILGDNCKGQAKLARLQSFLGTQEAPPGTSAYGDSRSDLPVLAWASHGWLLTCRGIRPILTAAVNRRGADRDSQVN
jgi:phosphatidylglycerophosphatase C